MGLTNTQYDTIMRDYQIRQNQDREEQVQRQKEAYRRIPQLADLDAEIAAASVECAREILEDTDNFQEEQQVHSAKTDDLRSRIKKISDYRKTLLHREGLPDDYLEMHYHCPDCKDTGYTGQEKCHCFRQAIIDLLYSQSNLREELKGKSFKNFSLGYYTPLKKDPVTGLSARETAERTLKECKRFVRDFDLKFENIFLYGDTGLGKTFLSCCIANELLKSSHSVIYFSAFRLFNMFADSAFGRTEDENTGELERHIFDCDLLIIDDLGTELVNSFVASQFFMVINERILRKKSTLISTNLSLETVAATYSERVFSRISSCYQMLKLTGDDIRIQKKISPL